MLACRSKLQGHVFAWNFVDQSQVDDGLLHLVQCDEATKSDGMLLRLNNNLVTGDRIRGKVLEDLLIDNMRS